MYIAINKDWFFEWYSNQKISVKDWVTIQLDNQSDIDKLQNGCKYENGEIIETPEYLEKISNIEKEESLKKIKEVIAKWDENMRKFNATQAIDENKDPNKEYKIWLIHEKAQIIENEYLQLEKKLVEKYWREILKELL